MNYDSKHRAVIDKLESILKDSVDVIETEEEYGEGNRVIGEIDLYTFCFDIGLLCVYEVKTNDSFKQYRKAIEQLTRAKKEFVKRKKYKYDIKEAAFFYIHSYKGNPIQEYLPI